MHRRAALSLGGALLWACMSPYEARHEGLWDARDQFWLSEESQVKLRAAQSRVFESTDRTRILAAVVQTLQDLGFMVGVLDEELGLVSGKRFDAIESVPLGDPSYHLYQTNSLLLFTPTWRSWGPFKHRNNLVRVTVTVRERNEIQSVVRVSAQFHLTAIEDPEPYRRFFRALEQSMFLEAHVLEPEAAEGG
jgi:hypothetical protein